MAGLLTHLIIVLIGFCIGTFVFKNWRYGLAFGAGQLIPDLISFGITGMRQGSLDPSVIMTNSWFRPLALLGHTFMDWIIFGLVVFTLVFMLFTFKKITKKEFKLSLIVLLFFLIGVGIHLIIDATIIETSYWI